jgi:hypothetical protein
MGNPLGKISGLLEMGSGSATLWTGCAGLGDMVLN